MNNIESLLQEPLFQHFHRICRIPHGSGNEAALAEELLCWAKEKGFHAEKDAAGNVLIRRSASPGCENAPPVMLQAHLDMVCVKRPGSLHDFQKDPIPWQIEGDWLTTGGETSLGAEVSCSEPYPGWEYQPAGRLRDAVIRVHDGYCGFEPFLKTVHAGLEVGFFLEKCPGLEAVSIGPDLKDLHSVSERLSISSALHFQGYLKSLLEELGRETGV